MGYNLTTLNLRHITLSNQRGIDTTMIKPVYEFKCDICKKTHIGTKAPDGWAKLIASMPDEDYGLRRQHPTYKHVCILCKEGERKKLISQGMTCISEQTLYYI